MIPKRIQLSRKRGWRIPADTVIVSRPTKWGNPFPAKTLGNAEAVRQFEEWLHNSLPGQAIAQEAKVQLKGKNLACWCKTGQPCHADSLLKLANE